MLAERLQPCVVALPTLRALLTSCRVRATDRAAASTSCESDDSAYGSFERPLARALDLLHTDVTCERTFQMQGCMGSNMSRFSTHFKYQPETRK